MRGLRSAVVIAILLGTIVLIQGCAGAGLTLLGVGAGTAAGTGTAYTLDGIAYRTFTASLEDVRRATARSLRRMDMPVKTDRATDSGRTMVALANDRTVTVDLEKLSARTTRMRVSARQGTIFRDRSTAGEIIAQTERSLDELPAVSHRTR
jgi:Protein of unknown function (DUF3568)